MNFYEVVNLLLKTMTEGLVIGAVLSITRLTLAAQLQRNAFTRIAALTIVTFVTIVPYGVKLVALTLNGAASSLVAQGYSETWLQLAIQGRLIGASIGAGACLLFARSWR